MDVIILAGGLGTRLSSVVNDRPKCMANVNNKPFLSYLFFYLNKFKLINNVILSLGYKSDFVISWLKDNINNYSFNIDYVVEKEPLLTGGGIKLALTKTLSNDVLILNGDTFFDIDIDVFYSYHSQTKANVSIALKQMYDFDRYGKVEINNNIVTAFKEKCFCKEGLINGGVYLIDKNKTNLLSFAKKFSFEKDFLEKKVNDNVIYGFVFNSYFIDIGIVEDYEKANEDFKTIF